MRDDLAALINRESAASALRDYTARLCTILRSRPDRDAPAIASWTLLDVAKHVASGVENYALWLEDLDAPDVDDIKNMSQWNIDTVRALPPADLPELADRIEAATFQFIEAAGGKPTGSYVRWWAGNRIPVQVAVCMRLIEAAVHGLDIAAAAEARWDIGSDDSRIMCYGLAYIGPYFVDEEKVDFEGTLRMRIRGDGDVYYIVQDRKLEVATAGPRPDWHLSVDPLAWVLVSTGRRNQWSAALRGKIIGWGKTPLLPFKVKAASFQG